MKFFTPAQFFLQKWLLWQISSLYFSQIARVAPQVYLSAATALVPSALEGLALTLVSTPWLFVLSICLLYFTYFNCLFAYYNAKVINTTTELPILPLERAVGVRVPLLDSPSGRCSLFERNQCSSDKRVWALCIKENLPWQPLSPENSDVDRWTLTWRTCCSLSQVHPVTITSDSTAYLGSFQTYHKYQILHHMFFIRLKPDINIVYSCQSLARYSHFCCWDFTDVTLAYEDGNLMSVDGLTCIRLVTPIWWLNYGQDFWSQILVKILRQPFGQILEGEVCSSFWGWNLV